MKKLGYLFSAFAMVAFIACSSEDVVNTKDEASLLTKQSISFTPLSKGSTRSQVVNSIADISSFRVVGLWKNGYTVADLSKTSGSDNFSKLYIKGENIAYSSLTAITAGTAYGNFGDNTPKGLEIVNNSGFNYKNSSDVQYWPFLATLDETTNKPTAYSCMPLDFRAITPANTDVDLTTTTVVTGTYNTPAVADMVDICYAEALNKTNADAPVKLQFHHIFSQVLFRAKKSSNYQVDIKKVAIGGVSKSGSHTDMADFANPTTWGTTAVANAGDIFNGYGSASYFTVPEQAESEKPAKLTPDGQELLLIPQNITKWAHDGTTKATESKQGYIAITYRYKKTGDANWATASETGADTDGFVTTYFPLEAKWKSGKKYTYSLLFGGATDPQKDPDPENPDPGTGDDNPGGYDDDGRTSSKTSE